MDTTLAQEAAPRKGLTEEEVAKLASNYGRTLYRFILRKVRNPSDAEDILQSALCEAFRVRQSFMWQAKPETWLCAIAFNMIRNYYARSDHFRYSFESEDILEDAAAEGQDPLEIISRNEVTGFIERQFRCLPEEMRKTLALVAEQNHSYEEAAAAMGIPIGTVRSRIFRARAYLKEWGSMDMLTT